MIGLRSLAGGVGVVGTVGVEQAVNHRVSAATQSVGVFMKRIVA